MPVTINPQLVALHELSIDPETLELLRKHGIHTLGQMIEHTESSICHWLIGDLNGFDMTNEDAGQAVNRFEKLREITDNHCVAFQGPRREFNDLWSNL